MELKKVRRNCVVDPQTRRQEFEGKMEATIAMLCVPRLQIKQKSYSTILQEMIKLEEELSECEDKDKGKQPRDQQHECLRLIKRDI